MKGVTGERRWKEWQRGWARKSYGGEVEGIMEGQMEGVKRMTDGS